MNFKKVLAPLLLPLACVAQPKKDTTQRFSFHFQQTVIGQHHPHFGAKYYGQNTQDTSSSTAYSLTTTLFLGAKLWKNADLYFNPEVAGGSGLGRTLGIAGFPNGETYRVGNPSPTLYVARVYLVQNINLGGTTDTIAEDYNQVPRYLSSHRLSFVLGKYCLSDFYDANSYSHDPRTQFFNWSLMSAGAWDYAANTRGYTWGLTAMYTSPGFGIRGGIALEPETANGPYMDLHIDKAYSLMLEIDKKFSLAKRDGVIRLIGFYNSANMGSYQETLNNPILGMDVTQTRSYNHKKAGVAVNAEYALSSNSGLFGRISWNDGKNETWAFTEIDQSLSLGYVLNGSCWKRKADQVGVAGVVNGLSNDHKNYLVAGGYGFIIGDGALEYGYETILEAYYRFQWNAYFSITPDYQFVIDPAYNKGNGPIHLIGVRAHISI